MKNSNTYKLSHSPPFDSCDIDPVSHDQIIVYTVLDKIYEMHTLIQLEVLLWQ